MYSPKPIFTRIWHLASINFRPCRSTCRVTFRHALGGLANHNTLGQLTNLSPWCISERGASYKQEIIGAFKGEGTEQCRIKVNYVKKCCCFFCFFNEALTHVRLHPINTSLEKKKVSTTPLTHCQGKQSFTILPPQLTEGIHWSESDLMPHSAANRHFITGHGHTQAPLELPLFC